MSCASTYVAQLHNEDKNQQSPASPCAMSLKGIHGRSVWVTNISSHDDRSISRISESQSFSINTINKSMISNMEYLISVISIISLFIRKKKISVLKSWTSTFCFRVVFFGLVIFGQFVRQGRIADLCLYYRLNGRLSGRFSVFSLAKMTLNSSQRPNTVDNNSTYLRHTNLLWHIPQMLNVYPMSRR